MAPRSCTTFQRDQAQWQDSGQKHMCFLVRDFAENSPALCFQRLLQRGTALVWAAAEAESVAGIDQRVPRHLHVRS
eukprot:3935910-Rhodomonas_salina.2